METLRSQVTACARYVSDRLDLRPEWGVIMGTGQHLLAEELVGGAFLPYQDLPHFPPATSPSHQGRLCWGRLAERPLLVFQGRVHIYEGYTPAQVSMPVRLLAALGVKNLILTNAAGGLNPLFRGGDLMVIADHINLLGENPLVGENVADWGPRFPDLSQAYDRGLQELAEKVACQEGIALRRGVYVAVKGPSLETPAENQVSPAHRRRCRGDVHRHRGHRRGACGPASPGVLRHQQRQPARCHGPHHHRGCGGHRGAG